MLYVVLYQATGANGSCIRCIGAPIRASFPSKAALPAVPDTHGLCLHWTVSFGGTEWTGETAHRIATAWRAPALPSDAGRLYEEVALMASAAAGVAWPLPADITDDDTAAAIMEALLRALWRAGDAGLLRYGEWKRPPGGTRGHQVRHWACMSWDKSGMQGSLSPLGLIDSVCMDGVDRVPRGHVDGVYC